jgi:hypothetical protein
MAMVKKTALGCVVLLVACLLLCVVFRTLRTAIGVATARRQPVDIYDLVIDASVFPPSWYTCLGPLRPPERARGDRLEQDMLYAGFCPVGFDQGIGGAQHAVFDYGDELGGAIAFRWDFSRHEFSNRYTVSPFAVPEQWSYRSPVADRFKFACAEVEPFGEDRPVLSCEALAQYDEYISLFSAQLSHMTLEDLERILVAIDERMALYLGEDGQ